MSVIPPAVVRRRLQRGNRYLDRGTKYVLGRGGYNPLWDYPSNPSDCSGFIADVLELRRRPKTARPFWIETTAIRADAVGKHLAFVQLAKPEAGCLVVYGDENGHEGHVALVTQVWPSGRYNGIDCSLGSYRKFGDAVQSRSLDSVFDPHPSRIFCTLKQDLDLP